MNQIKTAVGKWQCIQAAATECKVFTPYSSLLGSLLSPLKDCLGNVAVSYTHLDVYKRQEHELQLQSFDGQLHLLDASDYTLVRQERQSYMPRLKAAPDQRRDLLAYLTSLGGIAAGPVSGSPPPVSQADIDRVMNPRNGEWTTYNGSLNGNRYSPLDQVNTSNVQQLQPQFIFSPGGSGLEGTPVVMDGIMYVTGNPQTCAINARTGSSIWCTPRTNGLGSGVSGSRNAQERTAAPKGPNRGVALLGDRIFYVSDDAFMVCLNRLTGAVMWSQPLPEAGATGKLYSSCLLYTSRCV